MDWYCDGSLHEICVTNDLGDVIIERIDGTNNENEFRAMILALEKAKDGDCIYSDSLFVINLITGKWKVKKEHLKPLLKQAKELLNNKKVEWISRDFNLAGHILETKDYQLDFQHRILYEI